MNIRALRLFRQVILTGSLAQASSVLNMSPSAASRLLTLLESEIGLTLFNRQKRQLELTREGDLFYRQTAHILSGLEEIPAISREIRQESHERLSLVTAAPVAIGLIAPALATMRRSGAEFDCTLNVETRFDIESKVAARGYNLGIISLPVENAIVDLAIEPFLEARLQIAVPAEHRLAGLDEIPVDELAGEPIVALRTGQRWRDRLDDLLGTDALPQIVVETSSTVVAMQLVSEGVGLALADWVCGASPVRAATVLRPLVPATWVRYAGIYGHGPRTALVQRFMQALVQSIAETRRRNPGAHAALRPIETGADGTRRLAAQI